MKTVTWICACFLAILITAKAVSLQNSTLFCSTLLRPIVIQSLDRIIVLERDSLEVCRIRSYLRHRKRAEQRVRETALHDDLGSISYT